MKHEHEDLVIAILQLVALAGESLETAKLEALAALVRGDIRGGMSLTFQIDRSDRFSSPDVRDALALAVYGGFLDVRQGRVHVTPVGKAFLKGQDEQTAQSARRRARALNELPRDALTQRAATVLSALTG